VAQLFHFLGRRQQLQRYVIFFVLKVEGFVWRVLPFFLAIVLSSHSLMAELSLYLKLLWDWDPVLS